MRITLVGGSLRGGGAERVMSIMANHWADQGWKVTLLTYDDGTETPAYSLSVAVDHRPLGIESASSSVVEAVRSNFGRLLILRRAIKEGAPDVVISFLDVVNVRTILASWGLGIPVIVSEHNDPSFHQIGSAWRILRRWFYRYATRVVTLTPEALLYFPKTIRRRGLAIPNPLSSEALRGGSPTTSGRAETVMAMGRLAGQKGFDRLIRAFSMVAAKHPGWTLTIWGEGDERQALERLRDRMELQGRVALPGWTPHAFAEMRRAGLFVVSSRYEGFCLVLCEAMACGAPVVSFDCSGLPRDLVRDGVDGILVPPDDVEQLAAAMDRLMSDPSHRELLAANGMQVAKRFRKDNVMDTWERVIGSCIPR